MAISDRIGSEIGVSRKMMPMPIVVIKLINPSAILSLSSFFGIRFVVMLVKMKHNQLR